MGETSEPRRRASAPRRADLVVAAGAAVVLAMLTTTFLVVEPGTAPTERTIGLQAEQAEQPPDSNASQAPPPVSPFGSGQTPTQDPPAAPPPSYTPVTGVARVSASGPAGGGTGPQPVCDYRWAPRVRLDDGTVATVDVPGTLSGLVATNGRATWNCDYTYRARVRDDAGYSTYVDEPGAGYVAPYGY